MPSCPMSITWGRPCGPRGSLCSTPTSGMPPAWKIASCALILAAVTVFAVRGARRYPYVLVGWLWYLGTLAPVIGIVQVGSQSMADRYTYIPLAGIFIALAWALRDLRRERARLEKGPHRRDGCFARRAHRRGKGRRSGPGVTAKHFSEHALQVIEANPVVHNNLGVTYLNAGDHDKALATLPPGPRTAARLRGRPVQPRPLRIQGGGPSRGNTVFPGRRCRRIHDPRRAHVYLGFIQLEQRHARACGRTFPGSPADQPGSGGGPSPSGRCPDAVRATTLRPSGTSGKRCGSTRKTRKRSIISGSPSWLRGNTARPSRS